MWACFAFLLQSIVLSFCLDGCIQEHWQAAHRDRIRRDRTMSLHTRHYMISVAESVSWNTKNAHTTLQKHWIFGCSSTVLLVYGGGGEGGGYRKKKRIIAQWWEFQSCSSSYTKTPFAVENPSSLDSIYEKSKNTPKRSFPAEKRQRVTRKPQFIPQYYAIRPAVKPGANGSHSQTLRVSNTSHQNADVSVLFAAAHDVTAGNVYRTNIRLNYIQRINPHRAANTVSVISTNLDRE